LNRHGGHDLITLLTYVCLDSEGAMRKLLVVIVVGSLALCAWVADDPEAQVERAKEGYEAALKKAKAASAKHLDAAEKTAQKRGNLSQIKKVQRARDLLESRNVFMERTLTPPERSQLKNAKERVLVTLKAASRDFVRAGKISDAERMEREHKSLSLERRVWATDIPDDAVKFGRYY
jgi:hypothetical protein